MILRISIVMVNCIRMTRYCGIFNSNSRKRIDLEILVNASQNGLEGRKGSFNGQWVSIRIEYPFVKRKDGVLTKQQVQILHIKYEKQLNIIQVISQSQERRKYIQVRLPCTFQITKPGAGSHRA